MSERIKVPSAETPVIVLVVPRIGKAFRDGQARHLRPCFLIAFSQLGLSFTNGFCCVAIGGRHGRCQGGYAATSLAISLTGAVGFYHLAFVGQESHANLLACSIAHFSAAGSRHVITGASPSVCIPWHVYSFASRCCS